MIKVQFSHGLVKNILKLLIEEDKSINKIKVRKIRKNKLQKYLELTAQYIYSSQATLDCHQFQPNKTKIKSI